MKKLLAALSFVFIANIGQASEIGRYQLILHTTLSRDQFMIDTKTGRAWQIVVNKEGRNTFQSVDYPCFILSEKDAPKPMATSTPDDDGVCTFNSNAK